MTRSRLLDIVVLVFSWLPILAFVAIGGWLLGYRVVALAAGAVLVGWTLRRSARRRRARRPLLELAAISVAMGALGAAAFGGLGAIIGLGIGVTVGLGTAYDLELENRAGVVAPFDPEDPVQMATFGKTFGLFMLVSGIGLMVALIVTAITR